MLIVGLTGGIASGKSTVSALLQKDHHIPLIDLDVLARDAVAPNTYALQSLVSHFGTLILLPSGSLNREKLGEIIFNNEGERAVLNGIVHPAVRRLLAWELAKCWIKGEKIVVVDAPLLIEAGLWKFCGAVVVVYCSEQLQLKRLESRNDLSPTAALARLRSQSPLSSKLIFADQILDNSGPPPSLPPQVSRLVSKLRNRVSWDWWISWLFPPWGIIKGLAVVGWRLKVKGVGREKKRGKGTRGERRGEEFEMKERETARL